MIPLLPKVIGCGGDVQWGIWDWGQSFLETSACSMFAQISRRCDQAACPAHWCDGLLSMVADLVVYILKINYFLHHGDCGGRGDVFQGRAHALAWAGVFGDLGGGDGWLIGSEF